MARNKRPPKTEQREETEHQPRPLDQVLKDYFEQITSAAEQGLRLTGIPTGYEKLDRATAGLHRGDVTIIAARPGMGKTAFASNIAVNVASPRVVNPPASTKDGAEQVQQEPGDGVLLLSLGMPREQIATRLVCAEGRVDINRLRQGFLQPDDWQRLTVAASYLASLPLWIDDTPSLTIDGIDAKVRQVRAEYDRKGTADQPERRLGLVIVDYLQMCEGKEGTQNREEELSFISRRLKALAMSHGLAVIAISQMNRLVESRMTGNKRPQLSDLRGSGSIEDDADTILLIYRDEYYYPETTNAKGIAEIIIAKQRNGPTNRFLLRFASACMRFDNLAVGGDDLLDVDE